MATLITYSAARYEDAVALRNELELAMQAASITPVGTEDRRWHVRAQNNHTARRIVNGWVPVLPALDPHRNCGLCCLVSGGFHLRIATL
jgi:hypothetical protein